MSLTGIASPRYKHGRHSKNLPSRLAGKYQEALEDPDLLNLQGEIALTDTLISDLLESSGSMPTELLRENLMPLIDQRRRLVDSESKRRVQMQDMITSEQALLLVGAVMNVIRERVHDRKLLSAIATDISGLVADARR